MNELITNSEKAFIYQYSNRFWFWYYKNTDIIKWIINQWLSEISLKDIINSYRDKNISEILDIINEEVLFNYLNAISIYLDILKAVFKFREGELNEHDFSVSSHVLKFDINTYLEMWAYLPLTRYMINKWVDRESVIYLRKNVFNQLKLKRPKSISKFFRVNKDIILNYLRNNWKILILKELQDYIY